MKKIMYLVMFLIISVILCSTCVIASDIQSCPEYKGSNVNAQNYETWSAPVYSYIVPEENGCFMQFEYIEGADGMIAEYYSSDYNLKNTVTVPYELPIFGGFYSTESNYYILSGQKNPNESVSVEVFRFTKYDKSWNRIGAVGLKKCNTTVPFDAGSARFASCGDYVIVRTSHEMYRSGDGLNHQANLTLQINTQTMEITSSQTSVSNNKYGYVSHSFNQFVQVDNNALIAVDHGDANPRSVALLKYAGEVSDGDFTQVLPNACTVVNMLTIPGEIGENYTGCSVGGFEYSNTSYLVAGSSVLQDTAEKQQTRNIFIASVPKNNLSSDAVTLTYLTDYKEGEESAPTPHLVKISDNRFVVLWSRLGKIHYAELDSEGKLSGEIKEMKGELSDCSPVVMNGKLIWYTRANSKKTFYEIDLNNPDSCSKVTLEGGHDYRLSSGNIYECTKCSAKVTAKLPTYVYGMWESTENEGYYSSATEALYHPETTVRFLTGYGNSDEAECELKVVSSDESVIGVNYNSADSSGVLTLYKPGTATVTVQSVLDSSINTKFIFNVDHSYSGWTITVEPGCNDGEKKRSCSICGYFDKQTVAATGHSFTSYISNNDATCEKDGTKTAMCDNCTQEDTVADVGTKKKHVFTKYESDNNATCSADGTKTAKCDNCTVKDTVFDAGSKKVHSFTVYVSDNNASCETDGTKTAKCDNCTVINTISESGSKKGHAFTAYISDKNATYSADGTKTATCSNGCTKKNTVNDKGSKLVLGIPLNVKLSQTTTTVTLSWNKVQGARGYRIFKYENGWKTLKTTSSSSYTVSGLKSGTKYTFAVRAYVVEKGKTVWAPKYVTVKTAAKPVPPKTVKASGQGTAYVTLTWSKSAGATGYRVYRYDSVNKKWLIAVNATAGTKVTVKDLSSGTSYIFAVKPYVKTNSGNVWAGSYTKLTTATKPATPMLRLASTAKGRATVAWNNVSGETGYQIWYSTKESSGYKKLSNYAANTVKVYRKGFTSGKTYYFRVRAYKKVGSSYIYSAYSPVGKLLIK